MKKNVLEKNYILGQNLVPEPTRQDETPSGVGDGANTHSVDADDAPPLRYPALPAAGAQLPRLHVSWGRAPPGPGPEAVTGPGVDELFPCDD